MTKDSRDSRRKNELITSRRIPIDIYKGKNEVRGKSIVSSSKRDNKNQARDSVIELYETKDGERMSSPF